MQKDTVISLVEWLKPIAHNDTDRGIKYNPVRAFWATVILSAFVTDHATTCNRIRKPLDWDYINCVSFEEDLENVGCKISANDIRRSLVE